jgi:hypothetical protein
MTASQVAALTERLTSLALLVPVEPGELDLLSFV